MRHPVRPDRPEQDGDGVGLIIVGRAEAAGTDGGHHRGFVGIAFARSETLDRADRDALVGNAPQLGPCGKRGHESPVDVARVGASVAANLLEPDRGDGAGQPVDLGQPVGEAEIPHAAAVKPAGAERDGAAGDQTVMAAHRPASRGAEIEREDAAVAGGVERQRFKPCAVAIRDQSRLSHDGSPLPVACGGGRRRRSGAWRYGAAVVGLIVGGRDRGRARARYVWGRGPP